MTLYFCFARVTSAGCGLYRHGPNWPILIGMSLVFSQRSRSLNSPRVTKVSRSGWTILVCTQALFFLAEFAWADPFRVVAIGASNTSGWTVSSEQAYPRVLEQMLRTAGYEAEITNSGRPFDTTAGMLTRLDTAVPDRTDLVILQPGGNDRRFFVSAEQRTSNIAEITDHLRSRRIAVIVFDPVFPDDYYSFDHIHFTPEAHAKIAAELMPRVITKIQAKQTAAKSGRASAGPAK
jgi:acyl-CoA thioesterase I